MLRWPHLRWRSNMRLSWRYCRDKWARCGSSCLYGRMHVGGSPTTLTLILSWRGLLRQLHTRRWATFVDVHRVSLRRKWSLRIGRHTIVLALLYWCRSRRRTDIFTASPAFVCIDGRLLELRSTATFDLALVVVLDHSLRLRAHVCGYCAEISTKMANVLNKVILLRDRPITRCALLCRWNLIPRLWSLGVFNCCHRLQEALLGIHHLAVRLKYAMVACLHTSEESCVIELLLPCLVFFLHILLRGRSQWSCSNQLLSVLCLPSSDLVTVASLPLAWLLGSSVTNRLCFPSQSRLLRGRWAHQASLRLNFFLPKSRRSRSTPRSTFLRRRINGSDILWPYEIRHKASHTTTRPSRASSSTSSARFQLLRPSIAEAAVPFLRIIVPDAVFISPPWEQRSNLSPLLRSLFESSNENVLFVVREVVSCWVIREHHGELLRVAMAVSINESTTSKLVLGFLIWHNRLLLHVGLVLLRLPILSFLLDTCGFFGLLEHLLDLVLTAVLVQSPAFEYGSGRCHRCVDFRTRFERLLSLKPLLFLLPSIEILAFFPPPSVLVHERLLGVILHSLIIVQLSLQDVQCILFRFKIFFVAFLKDRGIVKQMSSVFDEVRKRDGFRTRPADPANAFDRAIAATNGDLVVIVALGCEEVRSIGTIRGPSRMWQHMLMLGDGRVVDVHIALLAHLLDSL